MPVIYVFHEPNFPFTYLLFCKGSSVEEMLTVFLRIVSAADSWFKFKKQASQQTFGLSYFDRALGLKFKILFTLAFNVKSVSPLLQVLFDELTVKWSKKLGISGLLYDKTAPKSFPVKFWCVDHPQWSENFLKGHSYFHKVVVLQHFWYK